MLKNKIYHFFSEHGVVLIELFARCYRGGATSEYPRFEYRLKVSDFAPTGSALTQKFT